MNIRDMPWACGVCSAALAMNTPVEELAEIIGHDGSEVLYPDLPSPQRYRGFHVQEFVDVGWFMGYSWTPFEFQPGMFSAEGVPPVAVWDSEVAHRRAARLLDTTYGVLELKLENGLGHMVVWDEMSQVAYDSRGFIWNRKWVEDQELVCLWAVYSKEGD